VLCAWYFPKFCEGIRFCETHKHIVGLHLIELCLIW